ncbi:MAG TPA: bacillithiol biosynthesis BshC [Gemmatimonadaceae bacterium]|nr:bacillithiol biosynthesis BshC [Gemmatimonadaceae bacterium]
MTATDVGRSVPRVVTEPISGNALASLAVTGKAPSGWYEPLPRDAEAWRKRVETVRAQHPSDWLERQTQAIQATGRAAERLHASAGGRGVVVTTGQQPGLFGGPVYTLSKALSALALADELEELTGIPVAPVFWAATDDADFKEASRTAIAVNGGAQLLRIDHTQPLGRSMAHMPLGDASAELEALTRSAGSAVDPVPLELLERAYTADATIGSAYVSFLRALLEPFGIAVLDASHAATLAAARPVVTAALKKAATIHDALAARNREIEAAGHHPQVQEVAGLSLVFSSRGGERKRVPIKSAAKESPPDAQLGPNVLLRPVVERAMLPTVTYVGGPAEIAYFAQIGPIADTLDVPRPAIVPRWSCTIVEPHVERILEKLYLLPEDLRDPHEVERRVARSHLPKAVIAELNATRAVLNERLDALTEAVESEHAPLPPSVTGGLRANLMRRLDRFERRLISGAKRRHADVMQEIATARGSLWPFGNPQERVLNFVPFLARYGPALIDDMLSEARQHAELFTRTGRRERSSMESMQPGAGRGK